MSPKPQKLFKDQPAATFGPVTCLGMEFESDDARREYFTDELRKKLQDPEFRAIEGFPLGEDADILALSDPPYYTACPNPWIKDFIEQWENQKSEARGQKPEEPYHREPFAADVKEGKNDPIYNAHSYHTKVPHKAIMRYILHYTEPGDIVFDGFCGTGMTGVAAQMCGDQAVVESLGYQVKQDDTILQQETNEEGKTQWVKFSRLGVRRAVLNDLSPAATFIAYNYNTPVDVAEFEEEARRILDEVKTEYGWMYEVVHPDGVSKSLFDYVVWSEVFICPNCQEKIVFFEVAFELETHRVKDTFSCSSCKITLKKKGLEKAYESLYDPFLKTMFKRAMRKPVSILYRNGKEKIQKDIDDHDEKILKRIEETPFDIDLPIDRMMHSDNENWGDKWRSGTANFSHTHHIFLKRQAVIVSILWGKVNDVKNSKVRSFLKFWLDQSLWGFSLLNRYKPIQFGRIGGSQVNQYLPGVYYLPSLSTECSPWYNLTGKLKRLVKSFRTNALYENSCQSTASSTNVLATSSSIDYLFLDPPFGNNFAYAELNFIEEAFHRIFTNIKEEAIESKVQQKGALEYRNLMIACFKEAYRLLKPGRWLTIEFSNTKASVWNSIQTGLSESGFMIANVSALDKKQGGFNAVTNPTSVKQDLIISAYKPNGGFEERFLSEASSEEGVWDFVRTHLKYLPITKRQGSQLVTIPERDPRILFDQMVAYYVRKGYPVPLSSQEFQIGLSQRFAERDGMIFLPEQVAEYDRKKMTAKELIQASLFVSDEATAIQWLRQLLKSKPQTFSDINPHFMQEISGWKKIEKPLELSTLLKQNFLPYDGKEKVPEQIHAYLSTNWKDMRNLTKEDPILKTKAKDRWYVPDPNKAGDLEKLRERDLLKEFETYKTVKKFKRNDRFRLEAVRAGFKTAWQARNYKTIITIAKKIPPKILEEDPKLLMWYDQAVTRMGDA